MSHKILVPYSALCLEPDPALDLVNPDPEPNFEFDISGPALSVWKIFASFLLLLVKINYLCKTDPDPISFAKHRILYYVSVWILFFI